MTRPAEISTSSDAAWMSGQSHGTRAPLSFAQERFLFLHHFTDGSAIYNVPCAIELTGPLDRAALQRALDTVVERHEILRTGYAGREQIVRAAYASDLQLTDLTPVVADEREARLTDIILANLQRPFDLEAGTMLRAHLFAMAQDHHVLAIDIHHIACDEWSINLLVSELRELYEAARQGRAPDLAPSSPYRYFAIAQRRKWESDAGRTRIASAADRLGGDLIGTVVAGERIRPAIQTYDGDSHLSAFSEAEIAGMRRLGVAERASASMILMAATQLLLFRYTTKGEVSVGMPMTGRMRAEWQQAIGCYLNTLVVRSTLTPEMTVADCVRTVRTSCLESYEVADVPFEKLVEALQPTRDLSHNPLFQIMVLMKEDMDPDQRDGGASKLRWHRRPVRTKTSKFDLTFEIEEVGDGAMRLRLRYNSALYTAAFIARMAGHFHVLLTAMLADPNATVGTLPLLTADEIAAHARRAGAAIAPELLVCAPQLIAACAFRQPDAPAILCGERALTFAELDALTDRLAAHIAGRGIGAGDRVGVCCPRSIEMVAAMLAIWRLGAAYVPIDQTYPADRLRYIIADAAMALVVGQGAAAEAICAGTVPLLRLDRLDGEATAAFRAVETRVADVSHIIYTSGSTGRPKGTIIEHSGVAALLAWARMIYSDDQLAHVLASTSICFDLSVYELFVPLAFGGCVHLVENILHLAQHPGFDRLTLINTVPSSIQQLLQQRLIPASVRVVNLAGEPLQQQIVDALHAETGAEAVYNLYGPTEDTTYSSWYRARSGETAPAIGAPLPGKAIVLLDAAMQSVPDGVLGEIYIAGIGLARGYLGRPELDAARFVRLPGDGRRLYRTGDLGRYREDGQLLYAGRIDNQVKLRGFRIELGEIEETLRSHPDVADAAVVLRGDPPGSGELAAYVATGQARPSPALLRTYLKERLPGFMLPASVTLLDALPMTLNSKVDRSALPPPAELQAPVRSAAAWDSLDRQVASAWKDILGRDRIGLNDNFFEVGGHSLLVLQLQRRLQEIGGAPISVLDLFRFTTIKTQADYFRGLSAPSAQRPTPHRTTTNAAAAKRKAVRSARAPIAQPGSN